MKSRQLSRAIAYCIVLAASTSTASIAVAQSAPPTISAPPIRSPVDGNGVNLATGGIEMTTTDLTIGSPGNGGLAHTRVWTGNGWRHGFFMTITTTATTAMVSVGPSSTSFTLSGGVYTSDEGNGATLTSNAGTFTYTASDGTVITFDKAYSSVIYYGAVGGLGTNITLPSGEKIALTYKTQSYAIPSAGSITIARLQSVNSTNGYQLKYSYGSDIYTINQVTGINNGIDYCDPTADSCTGLTQSWPSVSYSTATSGSNKQESVTDAVGRVTRFTTDSSGRMIGIKSPHSATDDRIISYDSNSRVATVNNINATWAYGWSLASGVLTATVTDPLSHVRVTTADTSKVVLLTDKDALNRTTTYQYDSKGRLTYAVPPEGTITSGTPTAGFLQYGYDARGNVTCTMSVSKTASGAQTCALPSTSDKIVTTASYPSSCTNQLICNKPTWTRGPLSSSPTDTNFETDYAYDAATGFITSVTAPMPTIGAVRPQTRYSYSNLYGFYKQTSGGAPVQAPTPITKLTAVSACATTSSCAGGADEIKATIGYGPQTSGTLNNLLPSSITQGAGNGTLTATNTSVYDMAGNLYSVDGPLAGTSDTVRYRYDAVHRLVGVVGPDPDGAGALKNRAVRTTYNVDDNPTLIEQGTVNSQSDPDWSSFTTLSKEARTYDWLGRLFEVDTPGPTASLRRITQYDYDLVNRPICVADRMKFYATLDPIPADPCMVYPVGTYGQDRLTQYSYDAGDQLTATITAFGTTEQRTDQTMTYTGNGKLATVKDAKNNLTTMEYDGFDRQFKTRYPSPTTPNTSSTTDYAQLGFDAASNVLQTRQRDGSTIGLTYDNVNRLIAKNLPGSEPDVSYSYDNLGRLTATASSTASLSTVYDQLGRVTRQTSPQGNTDYQYDLANRRTRLTWPDSFYVTYDYLLTGDMTVIRENGAASGIGVLATFGYDDLGRRTSLTRGNGAVTSYGYDAGSRLTSLAQDLAGTTSDQSLGFSYNPGSQITQATRSNDAYAFTQTYNANRSYSANGLNQYTAAGNASPTYDANANLTSLWGNTYSFSSENLLTSATGASSLSYDPALRLYQITGSAATTRFGYDGSAMIGEYNTSNALQRRYVFGPGGDEPLVWYEGSGTTDRRWLHADERGSITAVTDASGNAIAVNSYDEYGMPATSNIGRFQYTGQMWLSETGSPPNGLYHYKSRAYSPRLGRFLQTDPIGMAGGMNLYNYAGSDAVNHTDPNGTDFDTGISILTGNPWMSFDYGWDFGFFNNFFQPSIPSLGLGGGAVGGAAPTPPVTGADIVVTGKKKSSQDPVQLQPLQLGVLSIQPNLSAPKKKYKISLGTPPGAIQCFAGGHGFLAPADFPGIVDDIVLAGSEAGPFDGDLATAAVGQGGIYDVQRKNGVFYRQYTAAANFAVGAFLYGAGHTKLTAGLISDYYAARHSGNGPTPEQEIFRNLAFDVESGKVALTCGPMKD